MSKLLAANKDSSPLGSLMMLAFVIAGIAVLAWGTSILFSDRPDAVSQFALSAVLGGGFIAIGLFVLRGQRAQAKTNAWLDQHGTWITMSPVDFRTIKTDSVGRAESYCLVLEPGEADSQRYGLGGMTFETDEIFARSVPDTYRSLKIDVVIDPDQPGKVHAVSFNPQNLWNEDVRDEER
jgi:hypothetical protein